MITNPNRRIETTVNYDLNTFTPMRDHPFQVRDDSDMEQLMESIREYGVILVDILLNPIVNFLHIPVLSSFIAFLYACALLCLLVVIRSRKIHQDDMSAERR